MTESAMRYASCDWIEGGLAFNRRSLHACLIVHHQAGMPHLADFAGGDLPIDTLLRARNEIRDSHRRGEHHPSCLGCAHLKHREWHPPSHAFNIVGIAQYSHCNIKCNYCFLQTQDPASFSSGFRPYKIFESLRHLLDKGLLAPDAIIDWGGGEPTIYREFDAILAMTLERGALHYLHSNGVRFPEIIRDNPKAGRVHVICSVDAGFRETYLRMKRRDYLDTVWSNLSTYILCGCRVTLKYIVKDENCSDAEIVEFMRRAVEIGATEILTDIDYDFPDPSPEIIRALAKLKHLGLRAGLQVRHGFTGDNFQSERGVASRVDTAFMEQQLDHLAGFLRDHHYAVGESVDATAESFITTLLEHCAVKDGQIVISHNIILDLTAELAALKAQPVTTASRSTETGRVSSRSGRLRAWFAVPLKVGSRAAAFGLRSLRRA